MLGKVLGQAAHQQALHLLVGFGQQIDVTRFGHDRLALRVTRRNNLCAMRQNRLTRCACCGNAISTVLVCLPVRLPPPSPLWLRNNGPNHGQLVHRTTWLTVYFVFDCILFHWYNYTERNVITAQNANALYVSQLSGWLTFINESSAEYANWLHARERKHTFASTMLLVCIGIHECKLSADEVGIYLYSPLEKSVRI